MKVFKNGAIGFTLVELLVSMAILMLLASLLIASVFKAKSSARRSVCLSNLRQLGVGCQLYAGDNEGKLTGTLNDSSDDQNWLYPSYINALHTFECPSTENRVRSSAFQIDGLGRKVLTDLLDNATDTRSFGTSYEVYGFMNVTGSERTEIWDGQKWLLEPGILKTSDIVDNYVHKNSAYGLKDTMPGASGIWIMLDGDDHGSNYPDPFCNHGPRGENVVFCDGHARWVSVSEWGRSYELSQDEAEDP